MWAWGSLTAFERRGVIEVKGKGPTLTYLLIGRGDSVADGRDR